MPARLKASLATQLAATMLLTIAAAAVGSWIAALCGLLAMLTLLGIHQLLRHGSAGALLGARHSAVIACGVLVVITIVAAMNRSSLVLPGLVGIVLMLQYLSALASVVPSSSAASVRQCFPAANRRPMPQMLLASTILLSTWSVAEARDIRVRIVTTPKAATIFVDGKKAKRKTPTTLSLSPGDEVVLQRPGYETYEFEANPDELKVEKKLKEITEFTLYFETKTSNRRWANTRDLKMVVMLNGNADDQRVLRGRGIRRVGAIDQFEFEFDCPARNIKSIRMAALAGDDKWRCDYVRLRMVNRDGAETKIYTRVVNGWFSCDSKEGHQQFDIPLTAVAFMPPRK